MRIDPQLIKDLNSSPYAILEKLSIKEIITLLKQANHAYHQEGRPLFSDEIYEIVRAYLAKLAPDHPLATTEVGALPNKDKVKLPVFLGSLDKIREDPEALEKWKANKGTSFVVSDKLDGISCLLFGSKIYSRGNGTMGQDISHLLKHIKGIPAGVPAGVMVRGELVLSKKDWKTIEGQRTNPRNTVSGLAISKRPDKAIAALVRFVAYEVVEDKATPAMARLEKMGFETVWHTEVDARGLTHGGLSKVLLERRKQSPYEVDGIVVQSTKPHPRPEEGNPSYAFAFKSILTMDRAEVIVKEVRWNISKNALMKPVVVFDTVFLAGAHISRATAHNAAMIEKNNIGPGARIVVIRSGDVIPYILEVLTPSASGHPSLPDQIEFPWRWNDNHVEIVLKNPMAAEDYRVRQLENYVDVLGIKGLGPKVIRKLYHTSIDNVKKLVNVTKIDLYKATYSAKLTMKIYKNLQAIYNKGTCVEFMAASNAFGAGLGKKKFQLVTEAFPATLDGHPPSLPELMATRGVGERFARQFLDHIGDFYEFIEEVGLPCRSTLVKVEPTPDGKMSVYGKVIVFTGFRSKELEDLIVRRGGKVSSGVSSKTTIVVAKSTEDNSIKSETAKELGIPVIAYKTFAEEVGFEAPAQAPTDDAAEMEQLKADLEKEGLLEDDGGEESSDDEVEGTLGKKAECIRHAMNWANMKRANVFGKSAFDAAAVKEDIAKASPKLEALVNKVLAIDEQDLKKRGKLFKHVIFSDVTKRGFGAKIVAAALAAFGFTHAYDGRLELDRGRLEKTKGNNFAVLAGTQVYVKPINVDFKQKLLATYNARPHNVHGDDIRIIVLDSAYKEGIDLFDVKYVHLFEPILTYADEMQAVGRATRFCGQKGLHFQEGKGWPLHVFRYDHVVPAPISTQEFGGLSTSLDLVLAELNTNRSVMSLAREIERVCQEGAVDATLTKNLRGGGTPFAKRYGSLVWPKTAMENQCVPTSPSTSKKQSLLQSLLQFSPSQEFIRQYFQPSCHHKGMFLWHSIGSGKTCTAVGAASYSWEAEGYTILWVTRSTLRSDVYKNMFGDNSCLERIRDMVKAGDDLPEDMGQRKRLLSRSWIPPVSYRQFNNALKRQNRLYDFLIKRNGYSDPFRKTLLIIDEAHLMFSNAIKEKDRPDVSLLKAWLRNSYKMSKDGSARVLLMSATPITDNPFTFAALMNLTHTRDIPEDAEAFTHAYLDASTLSFTKAGEAAFKEDIAGRLSYLNRMKDARQFAQPIFHDVHVPISQPADLSPFLAEISRLDDTIEGNRGMKIGEAKKALLEEIEATYEVAIAKCEDFKKAAEKKSCVTNLKKEMREEKQKADDLTRKKVASAKEAVNKAREDLKVVKKAMRVARKDDNSILTVLRKRCYKSDKEDPKTPKTPKTIKSATQTPAGQKKQRS